MLNSHSLCLLDIKFLSKLAKIWLFAKIIGCISLQSRKLRPRFLFWQENLDLVSGKNWKVLLLVMTKHDKMGFLKCSDRVYVPGE